MKQTITSSLALASTADLTTAVEERATRSGRASSISV